MFHKVVWQHVIWRSGRIVNNSFTANLPRNLSVENGGKSIKIWQNYGHEFLASVFGSPCMPSWMRWPQRQRPALIVAIRYDTIRYDTGLLSPVVCYYHLHRVFFARSAAVLDSSRVRHVSCSWAIRSQVRWPHPVNELVRHGRDSETCPANSDALIMGLKQRESRSRP